MVKVLVLKAAVFCVLGSAMAPSVVQADEGLYEANDGEYKPYEVCFEAVKGSTSDDMQKFQRLLIEGAFACHLSTPSLLRSVNQLNGNPIYVGQLLESQNDLMARFRTCPRPLEETW